MVNFKIGDRVIVLDTAKDVGYYGPFLVKIRDLEFISDTLGYRVRFYETELVCHSEHLIHATPLNEALL